MFGDLEGYVAALESGPAFAFKDWPNAEVPRIAAGVYTIWDGEQFVYVGMAGRGLTAADIVAHRTAGGAGKGLWSRLNSHASGRRSGDQFCVYVCDRLVLPTLTAAKIAQIGAGTLSLDKLTREYIRQHLGFRFVETPDAALAHQLEADLRRGKLNSGKPGLNRLV